MARNKSEGDVITVHDMRRLSMNNLSPIRLIQKTPSKNSSSDNSSSDNIFQIGNPEKRLSIRPTISASKLTPCIEEFDGEIDSSEKRVEK
jgi:hypothetical protein